MKKRDPKSVYWLIAGVLLVLAVPVIRVLVEYETYIHPWRAELFGSVLLLIVLTAAFRNADFQRFLAEMPKDELRFILLPVAAFIAWSGLSSIWSPSTLFALYHTSVWIAYIAFYCLFRYYTRDETDIDRWLIGFIVFLWLISVPALFDFYGQTGDSEFSWLRSQFSKYAELANLIVPLIAAYSLRAKGTPALFGYATVILVWLCDTATLSRAGVGIFIIEIVALVLLTVAVPSLRQYRTKTIKLAVALCVITALSSAALIGTKGNIPIVKRVGDTSTAESSDMRRLFLNISIQMWREHPVLGIGADNYGREFSHYRNDYAQRAPEDPLLRLMDEVVAERAHNEYAQVLAELGTIGLLIFAAFLFGIAACGFYLWKARADISINVAAGMIGLAGFLASSFVSSYSFRVFQNGLVFFFVLAIVVAGAIAQKTTSDPTADSPRTLARVRIAIMIAVISSVFLAVYCLARVSAVYELRTAVATKNVAERARLIGLALKLDPDNALIYGAAGLVDLKNGEAASAATLIKKALDRGLASTLEYSFLATAQVMANDTAAASRTINDGLVQFPRSAFLHVRSGVLLNALGKNAEAEREFRIADDLDARQAATWRLFLEGGAERASQSAAYSNGVPMTELRPLKAAPVIQLEREMFHPEEKIAR